MDTHKMMQNKLLFGKLIMKLLKKKYNKVEPEEVMHFQVLQDEGKIQ